MRKFLYADKGSVSIYLIIITAGIFFFNAVLIDYARVMIAKKETDNTIRAAVRSVLSAYDIDLRSYGLYGLQEEEVEKIFKEALKKNLENSPGSFHSFETKIENASVDYQGDTTNSEASNNFQNDDYSPVTFGLWNHQIFKRQILEEMKYKAPVNFTLDMTEKFSNLSNLTSSLKKGSEITDSLDDVSNLYDSREKNILVAKEKMDKANTIIKKISLDSITYFTSGYNGYLKDKRRLKQIVIDEDLTEEEKDNLKKEKKELQESIDHFKNEVMKKMNHLQSYSQSDLAGFLAQATRNITSAREINDKIRNEISKTNNIKLNDDSNDNALLKGEGLLLEPAFFDRFEKNIANQMDLSIELRQQISSMKTYVVNVLSQNGDDSNRIVNQVLIKKNRINQVKDNYLSIENDSKVLYSNEEKKIEKANNERKEYQNKDIKKEASYKDIMGIFDSIKKAKNKVDEYDKAKELYKEYDTLNKEFNQSVENNNLDEKNPIKKISSLFSDLATALVNVRDELYVNEYVFDKFQSFDPTNIMEMKNVKDKIKQLKDTTKNVDSNNKSINKDHLLDMLDIHSQEVEYVIYGSDVPSGNISSVFRDIFLIRMGINTLEGFTDPEVRALTHPIAIAIGAILYGITKSVKDMLELFETGNNKKLSKFVPISVTYKDYLRLLFLFHPGMGGKLSRIQTIISLNTNLDLSHIPTYVEGKVTTSIKFMFLPKRYQIIKRAAMSY